MDEAVAGLEILRMLIIGLHDVRTVVLVGLAVLGIWLVEINLEVSYIIAELIGGTCLVIVLADKSVGKGIEVREIVGVLRHRLGHLISSHLHRGEGIAVCAPVRDEQVAGVCLYFATVGILDILQGIDVEIRKYAKLAHVIARNVCTRLRILYFSYQSGVASVEHRTCN